LLTSYGRIQRHRRGRSLRSNLIILGPQGSGKSTQAELLANRFGFALVGAGEELRKIAQEDSNLGRSIRQTVDVEGRLVQPEFISEIIKNRVEVVPKDRGLILDGYPRNVTQYQLFKEFWPETGRGDYRAIFIELPDEEAIKRLTTRVTCENCGAISTAGLVNKCRKCGGRLVRRPDDTPAAIQKRLQLFHAETLPMIQAMEADGKVSRINGARPIDEVHRDIVANVA
jgi:adenylate kinase